VNDDERIVLERALKEIAGDAVAVEPRAASAWWRAGVLEGDLDGAEAIELYALSPRSTRRATRA
jgi:hypothetical protein